MIVNLAEPFAEILRFFQTFGFGPSETPQKEDKSSENEAPIPSPSLELFQGHSRALLEKADRLEEKAASLTSIPSATARQTSLKCAGEFRNIARGGDKLREDTLKAERRFKKLIKYIRGELAKMGGVLLDRVTSQKSVINFFDSPFEVGEIKKQFDELRHDLTNRLGSLAQNLTQAGNVHATCRDAEMDVSTVNETIFMNNQNGHVTADEWRSLIFYTTGPCVVVSGLTGLSMLVGMIAPPVTLVGLAAGVATGGAACGIAGGVLGGTENQKQKENRQKDLKTLPSLHTDLLFFQAVLQNGIERLDEGLNRFETFMSFFNEADDKVRKTAEDSESAYWKLFNDVYKDHLKGEVKAALEALERLEGNGLDWFHGGH
uniref:Uncharacterized protein n=1 Tax=Chromera velia CCMP2878 TaxID=1169474 RepID=A0A0G4I7N7_9ALVE|eukprot:Cvel_11702.t1-p1 / transcript=Cvel_11702.t1 / gene=Cvel_11702 / organism=Chromera_velia_CCMP2878 / gene_product=hypothetical protein / transcript_product=hypothetical protein / location=Cvel_scaffold742:42492-44479(+) / protein_length=374 / sequence_SO=supercontig / SO=protein_coding / is_pseudo=false